MAATHASGRALDRRRRPGSPSILMPRPERSQRRFGDSASPGAGVARGSAPALRRARRRILLCGALAVLLSCGGGGGGGGGGGSGGPYLVGAHYYVWYPSNFSQGYLRAALRPAEAPALGEYDSRDPAVAGEHIALASSHGIDFFALDWWPNRPSQNDAIDAGFLRASNLGQIRFCIFYNSFGLGDRPSEGILFDAATRSRFVSDLVGIARRYFDHPSYLRVDGRPVIELYITREMRGLFPQAMQEMRQALSAEGYDPFVIGDEIFWGVIEANDDPGAAARVTGEPQLSRIRLFDAITAYNLYEGARQQDRGFGSASAFVGDSAALYRRYRDAGGVPIVPVVIPGFNDRGTRLAADHFVIPRRWAADAAEGSFFSESIERIARPLVDAHLRMVLITSWNEWNEDTAIEPVAPAPPTSEDRSGQQLFTQGYTYEGFGTTYLDTVSERLGG
ncbi:MAG: glycoside hydrolase family 99-like domain-containing protein [Deltaproteobacteria bacterium]|nr:glycoside hydrolase family 99-like domain-containing protein [Deltaproteobacteria bacterium]